MLTLSFTFTPRMILNILFCRICKLFMYLFVGSSWWILTLSDRYVELQYRRCDIMSPSPKILRLFLSRLFLSLRSVRSPWFTFCFTFCIWVSQLKSLLTCTPSIRSQVLSCISWLSRSLSLPALHRPWLMRHQPRAMDSELLACTGTRSHRRIWRKIRGMP